MPFEGTSISLRPREGGDPPIRLEQPWIPAFVGMQEK